MSRYPLKSKFIVHKENNFKVPNQMVIAKSEIHMAVFENSFLLLLDIVSFCVSARVRASVSQKFQRKEMLASAKLKHSFSWSACPLKMRALCFTEMCGNTRYYAPDE